MLQAQPWDSAHRSWLEFRAAGSCVPGLRGWRQEGLEGQVLPAWQRQAQGWQTSRLKLALDVALVVLVARGGMMGVLAGVAAADGLLDREPCVSSCSF